MAAGARGRGCWATLRPRVAGPLGRTAWSRWRSCPAPSARNVLDPLRELTGCNIGAARARRVAAARKRCLRSSTRTATSACSTAPRPDDAVERARAAGVTQVVTVGSTRVVAECVGATRPRGGTRRSLHPTTHRSQRGGAERIAPALAAPARGGHRGTAGMVPRRQPPVRQEESFRAIAGKELTRRGDPRPHAHPTGARPRRRARPARTVFHCFSATPIWPRPAESGWYCLRRHGDVPQRPGAARGRREDAAGLIVADRSPFPPRTPPRQPNEPRVVQTVAMLGELHGSRPR